ncbi:UNVERIFIED_CONTAM: hypothetical protein PYX00_004669 [Menopon gallinae]|uniref:Uncharacterized protein n=1 Tax=Menopon gallinae TaxID=328185 RepID=A0AAW2I4Q1_9NEOP
MRFDDSVLTKKLGTPAEEKRSNQIYDENYSIHSYKPPKEKSRAVGYEIREAPEEDAPDAKTGQRKARQSFDIYTARKANNLYEKANRARQQKKHAFHFEAMERKPRVGVRRSLTVEEEEKSDGKPRDAIPVHEVVEEDAVRRKRRDLREEDLAAGFRPLPKMPDGFIDKFAGSDFRPNGTTTERSREADKRNDVYDAPGAVQLRRNMVVSVRELQRRPGPTSGSELVKRSYEECAADRGSPLRDKDRLVVSWSETPVRIYGGAVVTTALGLSRVSRP